MAILNPDDHRLISAAVRDAEQRTSGEIVTVIAGSSDDYHYIPLLWAALIALIAPLPLVLFSGLDARSVYLIQLSLFITLALALRHPALKYRVVPAAIKRRRAHRQAVGQFLAQNLHATRDRTGVLIYASLAERYVEIIADEGIDAKIKPGFWDDVVAKMTGHLKAGEITLGFLGAINDCGAVLAEHFPPGAQGDNELPDQLIEI